MICTLYAMSSKPSVLIDSIALIVAPTLNVTGLRPGFGRTLAGTLEGLNYQLKTPIGLHLKLLKRALEEPPKAP